jgi:hypothetical protein
MASDGTCGGFDFAEILYRVQGKDSGKGVLSRQTERITVVSSELLGSNCTE